MSNLYSQNPSVPSLPADTERDREQIDGGEYIENNSDNDDENIDQDQNVYRGNNSEEGDEDMNQYEEGDEMEEHYEGNEDENQEQEDEDLGAINMNMNKIHNNPKADNLSKVSEQKEELDDPEEFDFLPPERKVRFRVLRFINKLREKYNLLPFYNDLVGNKVAMAYAKHLLREKENEAEVVK